MKLQHRLHKWWDNLIARGTNRIYERILKDERREGRDEWSPEYAHEVFKKHLGPDESYPPRYVIIPPEKINQALFQSEEIGALKDAVRRLREWQEHHMAPPKPKLRKRRRAR